MDYWKNVPGIDESMPETKKRKKKAERTSKMDYWKDVPGINESGGKDSQYVQNGLEALIDDFKHVPEEKHMVPALKHILSRLNQSFPDGDVTSADIKDLMTEPQGRKVLKKAKMSMAEFIDMVLEF